jgi:putative endonuclease
MQQQKSPAVYMLASGRHGTLYVGVTSDLCSRVSLHKQRLIAGFTSRYGVDRLVYVEFHEDMVAAIGREKQIKGWKRAWKIELIEANNPQWLDRYAELCGRFD